MRASGASSGSRSAALASPRATSASMTSSRRSGSSWSAMVSRILTQVLERAQLQLLDRAFGSIERRGHLADSAVLDEPHLNHLPLRIRQAVHELKQTHAPLEVLVLALVGHIGRQIVRVTSFALPVISERIRRDAIQPRDKRHAA